MNKLTRKKISIKRKEQLNKKLAFQVIFSIVLVSAVIVTKKLDTDLSKQFLHVTNETVSESIQPKKVSESVKSFVVGVQNKIPFLSKDNAAYSAPVSGKVYLPYGLNKNGDNSYYNHGLDIISNTQSVRSISDGKVVKVGNNDKLSNYVVIEEDGRTIIYGKIMESFVKEGEKVSKGTIIGALDEENRLLHLEVWEGSESINPSKLFDIND